MPLTQQRNRHKLVRNKSHKNVNGFLPGDVISVVSVGRSAELHGGSKSKLLAVSEYVNKTEKIGGT